MSIGYGSRIGYPEYPGPWVDQALCREVDTDLFYPEKGHPSNEAKRICRACPVRAECLQYALRIGERFGIWGGLSERERRRLADKHKTTGTTETPAAEGTAA